MTSETFEQILNASQGSGDYNPTWKRFVKTRFFVPMLAERGAHADDQARFHVTSNSQNGKNSLLISEHAVHLGNGNFHQTATMLGAEIVRKLGPEIGIVIAMSDRTFGMPAALVARLKKSLEAAQAKARSQAAPGATASIPVATPAAQSRADDSVRIRAPERSAFPTLDTSLISAPVPAPQSSLTLEPLANEKSVKPAALALEPVMALTPPPDIKAEQSVAPLPAAPKSASTGKQAQTLNIGALMPRNVFNESLGLLLYVPGAWKETKNAKSLQLVDPETNATLDASGMERTGRSVEQWSGMRIPMLTQEFPHLRQIGNSIAVNGNDWGNRIQATVTEFRGKAPGDDEESTYLLCCARTDSILIAITINARSRVVEKNRAVYDWIFSRLDVKDNTSHEKLEFDNEIVDEKTDRTGMVASGLRLMILSILGNFVLLRFLADAHHLVILYVAFCLLLMSGFGLYRIAQGLLVPIWGKILIFIGLAVPGLNLVLLIGLRWMARRYLRSAGYGTGLLGASEAVPKSNHDLRNVLIAGFILALPLYGLIRLGGGTRHAAVEVQAPFSPPDRSFEVQMPGTPVEVNLAPVPGATDSHLYQLLDGEWTYIAGYTEYAKEPDDLAHVLDSMGQYYADRAQGRIVAEKTIAFEGGDGKDVTIQQSDGALAEVQYGFVGQRLYMIEVVYPAAQKGSPKISDYLDSFSAQ